MAANVSPLAAEIPPGPIVTSPPVVLKRAVFAGLQVVSVAVLPLNQFTLRSVHTPFPPAVASSPYHTSDVNAALGVKMTSRPRLSRLRPTENVPPLKVFVNPAVETENFVESKPVTPLVVVANVQRPGTVGSKLIALPAAPAAFEALSRLIANGLPLVALTVIPPVTPSRSQLPAGDEPPAL